DAALKPLGKPQHVDGPVHAGLGRLHGIALIVNGRGRAGEVVDFVHLDIKRKRDVVAQELEMGTPNQVIDIPFRARVEIVEAYDVMAGVQQAIAKVGTNKTGAPGDQNRLAFKCATVCWHGAHSTGVLWGSALAGNSRTATALRVKWLTQTHMNEVPEAKV